MATELEIMAHAKSYIDSLAGGINPLNGEALPESDIVNQVRISRCLFYVSDVLRQVIENGGIGKPSSPRMVPFSLTEEQLSRFEYSDSSLTASAILGRINALTEDTRMKKLTYRSVASVLEKEGLLARFTNSQGRMRREPTEKGRMLGITMERRSGPNGDYTVVVYDRNAQHFLISHMDQLIEAAAQPSEKTAADEAEPES